MYEQKPSTSPLINCTWRATAEVDDTYSDPANEYWSLSFIRHVDGSFAAELYGPTLRPRILDGHAGESYWGVEFNAHVFVGGVDKNIVLGSHMTLPVTNDTFEIADKRYAIPQFNELEVFVEQLEAEGVVQASNRIYMSLAGDDRGASERTRQRHFKSVTGLTKKQIEQLQRARHAFYLLQQGASSQDAAHEAGYADQSHMIRSLKLLRGETPAQIIAAHVDAM